MAGFNFGSMSQFDDTNSIADPTVLVVAKAIPLKPNQGAFFQACRPPMVALETKDIEIYNRTKQSRTGTITANLTDSETDPKLDTTSIKGITVGSTIKIGTEYMWVSAVVSRSTGEVTVVRGVGGTTAASHTSGDAYTYMYSAINDVDLKNVESFFESTGVYTNYVQTLAGTIDYQHMTEIMKRKGLGQKMAYNMLLEEEVTRIAEELAYVTLNGKKQAGSASSPSMTDGVFNQLADTASSTRPIINYNASGAITEAKLRAALQEIAEAPGTMANVIWVSSANYEVMRLWLTSITMNNNYAMGVVGQVLQGYNYQGMMLTIKIDADMPDDKILLMDMNKCYYQWLVGDALRVVDEPQSSSREKRKSVQGSVGIAIEDVGYSHSYIYGVTV